MRDVNGWGLSFKRRHRDNSLKKLYDLRAFTYVPIGLMFLFNCRRSIMDMEFVQDGGTSFPKLCSNLAQVLKAKNSKFSSL